MGAPCSPLAGGLGDQSFELQMSSPSESVSPPAAGPLTKGEGVSGVALRPLGARYGGGMDACAAYLREFVAAVPLGQLVRDLKEGRVDGAADPEGLLRRLQIEFHYMDTAL
mmetsp:Transcript_29076/g.92795  ORF Transcript_29076/g.92795 Transcript_29076/m.92795 type:complete len:111 (-) Transcript_29076:95-427(-)